MARYRAFAATGALFLTGSDTSANALFGTLQVVTAGKLGMNPVLLASAIGLMVVFYAYVMPSWAP